MAEASTQEKRETPEGLWYKCKLCKHVVTSEDHSRNLWVCEECKYHDRIGSKEYFTLLFDKKFTELNANMESSDPLGFEDTKKYTDRISTTQKTTGLKDAIRTAYGSLEGTDVMIGAMDFSFIGGSMGSVGGEKRARAVDRCISKKMPLILI